MEMTARGPWVVLVVALHVAALSFLGRYPEQRPVKPGVDIVHARVLPGAQGGGSPTPPATAPSPSSNAVVERRDAAAEPVPAPTPTPSPISVSAQEPDELLREATPRSAPDLEQLRGLKFTGLPIRLRLSIDELGQVQDVSVVASSEAPEVIEAVCEIFEQTAFIPARRADRDVPTEMDIELFFAPS